MRVPEIKVGDPAEVLWAIEQPPVPGPVDGIWNRISLLAGEVRIACAPGTPAAVPPEINEGLRHSAKEVAAGRRTGGTGMKLWNHCNPHLGRALTPNSGHGLCSWCPRSWCELKGVLEGDR
jgi:hypothetical protein